MTEESKFEHQIIRHAEVNGQYDLVRIGDKSIEEIALENSYAWSIRLYNTYEGVLALPDGKKVKMWSQGRDYVSPPTLVNGRMFNPENADEFMSLYNDVVFADFLRSGVRLWVEGITASPQREKFHRLAKDVRYDVLESPAPVA